MGKCPFWGSARIAKSVLGCGDLLRIESTATGYAICTVSDCAGTVVPSMGTKEDRSEWLRDAINEKIARDQQTDAGRKEGK